MILVMKQSFIMVSYHIDWVSVFIIRRSIKVLLAHNSEMWKRQALRTVECVISHHWFIAGSQKERKNLIKVIDKRPQSQYLQRNCELKKNEKNEAMAKKDDGWWTTYICHRWNLGKTRIQTKFRWTKKHSRKEHKLRESNLFCLTKEEKKNWIDLVKKRNRSHTHMDQIRSTKTRETVIEIL